MSLRRKLRDAMGDLAYLALLLKAEAPVLPIHQLPIPSAYIF